MFLIFSQLFLMGDSKIIFIATDLGILQTAVDAALEFELNSSDFLMECNVTKCFSFF